LNTRVCFFLLAIAQAPAMDEIVPVGATLADRRWQSVPELSDEFDGDKLDDRWWPNNPDWIGRAPSYFHKGNVAFADGNLLLHLRKETIPGMPEGFTYTAAAIKSKALVKYGYFESRCKIMPAATSGFWLYNHTSEYWTEIDIFEINGAKEPRTVHMNNHVFPPSAKEHWQVGDKWLSDEDLIGQFHVYGCDWNEKEIIYYIDGIERRRLANTNWHDALHLNFDVETHPTWTWSDSEDSLLPAVYTIDYVRVWKPAVPGQ
jgi:beta-glucanase (GH16 family)